jgi:hypothetical protein
LARSFAQMARSAEEGNRTVHVSKEPLAASPLPIHTLGARELRTSARRISKVDASVRDLARDMLRSMYTAKGIGLAAPQVGVHRQLLVIDLDLEEAATPAQPDPAGRAPALPRPACPKRARGPPSSLLGSCARGAAEEAARRTSAAATTAPESIRGCCCNDAGAPAGCPTTMPF